MHFTLSFMNIKHQKFVSINLENTILLSSYSEFKAMINPPRLEAPDTKPVSLSKISTSQKRVTILSEETESISLATFDHDQRLLDY